MKRLGWILWFGLTPALGLAFFMGCSSSTGSSQGNYSLDLSVSPDTLQNGDSAFVSCFLYDPSGDIYLNGNLKFWTLYPVSSNITGFTQSDSTALGTEDTVTYFANSLSDSIDVIYAAFVTNNMQDTLASDSTTVHIILP